MSNEFLIKHCAPTLAGIKTGNMFSYEIKEDEDLNSEIRKVNKILVKYGLRMLPLRVTGSRALIYLYRPKNLEKDLTDSRAEKLLEAKGYRAGSSERCLVALINKIREGGEFPHEVGLFLGYPPEDVEGFIENKAGGYKFTGFWKVYGDVEIAKRRFTNYKKCETYYLKKCEEGMSLEKMVVA